ncbi:uncharacterized protein DS421_10g310060 [Arachis hypogaea]|nr:uncharacterized protein DS421_10g310060 [Arachis hypogaea]
MDNSLWLEKLKRLLKIQSDGSFLVFVVIQLLVMIICFIVSCAAKRSSIL